MNNIIQYGRDKRYKSIKVVLVEKKRTNKWLAEQLGKDPATVSKWCTNTSQPGLKTLLRIANVLEVDVKELLNSSLDESIQIVRLVKSQYQSLISQIMNKVGRSRSMKNMRQPMNLFTDMLCIKEDLYMEQLKFGEQQTIDDKVINDLYGVSGQELREVRTAIAGLQEGELIIKDQMAFALGMGKKYKKINVTHLI